MQKLNSKDMPKNPSHQKICLAQTENMHSCIQNLIKVHEYKINFIDHYLCFIDGLSGLHYLLQINPKNLHFFSQSLHSIAYSQLILELIQISKDHKDFISRVFCRSLDKFLIYSKAQDLNEFRQYDFLSEKYDQQYYQNTLHLLSKEKQSYFKSFLEPYLDGLVHFNDDMCRRLLPCWPQNENIPFNPYGRLAENAYGELEPNTNVFFYGCSWLKQKETYFHIQALLKKTSIHYYLFDPLGDDIHTISSKQETCILYMGRLTEKYSRENWSLQKKKWLAGYNNVSENLGIITAHHGLQSCLS